MNCLSDLIAWGSERKDIDKELYDKISEMSLVEIFKLYDESVDGESITNRKNFNHTRAVIADKLELPQRDIIVPFISNLFGDLSDRIDEIERIAKNHKHKTFGAGYSEKPTW